MLSKCSEGSYAYRLYAYKKTCNVQEQAESNRPNVQENVSLGIFSNGHVEIYP